MSKMLPRPLPWADKTAGSACERDENSARAAPTPAVGVGLPRSIGLVSIVLQVKAGGDAAALTGIMKALLALDAWAGKEAGFLDRDFIDAHIGGFDALVEDVHATSWVEIIEASGLRRPELEAVAQAYARSRATIVTYGRGMTRHETGTGNARLIADLLLLREDIARPGVGAFFLELRERGEPDGRGERAADSSLNRGQP